jgi:hypothetical protein
MHASRLLMTLATFLLASSAGGQDVSSGPEQGKKVPALKVFAATGPHKDKEVDYAAERKEKPTIYIFIQAEKWDRPMARFVRKLDDTLQKKDEDYPVVAVWLTDHPDKTKAYLPIAQQSLRFQKTVLTCFTGEQAGPKDWNINSDAHVTAVVTAKGTVASTFGYRSINETDAPAVLDAYKKALQKE